MLKVVRSVGVAAYAAQALLAATTFVGGVEGWHTLFSGEAGAHEPRPLLVLGLLTAPNLALAALGTLLLPDRRRPVVAAAAVFGLGALVAVAAAYGSYTSGTRSRETGEDLLGLAFLMWALPLLLALVALIVKGLSDRRPPHRAA